MNLRNIAIIAHVDHGKTTLVDALLKQSGSFRDNQKVDDRAMDRNDLEKERGITIMSKCTSVLWKDTRINIVDTPGHADFGGEVERILSMVDSVVLLVDAAEGALPQTKFVLGKALKLGLRPIVIINKIDRPDARPDEVHEQIFDLFASLDATEEQLDFPMLYASGRSGWAAESLTAERKDLTPLYELVLRHVPAPKVDKEAPLAILATILEADPFLGRVLTGRIASGRVKANQPVKVYDIDGTILEQGRVTKILAFRGLTRTPVDEAEAGDIVAIAGLTKATVANTIGAMDLAAPLKAQPIDPPTLAMTFSVNTSPLAGTEGNRLTSRQISDRLFSESEGNIAIQVTESDDKDSLEVAGRGELQLGVLIETMRREGFELTISRPRVLFKTDESGARTEPYEEVIIDVDEEYSGTLMEQMSFRKAELQEMRAASGGKTRLVFQCPSRGLIGFHGEFLTITRGTGVMNRLFSKYGPYKGALAGRRNGVLIANGSGETVAYSLVTLEERGTLFVTPGEKVYMGMIIGEHSRDNDLDVNPLRAKQLTNIRAAGKDEQVRLTPPRIHTLEAAIAYIQDDELVEVTPKSIRLRKRYLDPNERKRAMKSAG
ncbi:MAG: translational GTPase TypA [Alphaproteobacteria bacterium]|jgi:GTP-binding protein|nr:translational GTPase TypA [Alphaproteobacteria bacterium]